MKTVAIIPARMGSSRFPGKPMELICGVPMIGHCFFRTRMCKKLDGTYVATCDKEIYDYITSKGGQAVMTSPEHERASDRAAEAMLRIEKETNSKIDVVVMVQGDEPMIVPEMIDQSLAPFKDKNINVVNLMAPITNRHESADPNEVKVVVDNKGDAIYFSREPIPSDKKINYITPIFKQVCIIPFRRQALLEFNATPETKLEKIESVDMLRLIENGEKIRMVPTDFLTYSVDTREDLLRVEALMTTDPITELYL